jgi:hypothetical protein
MAECCDETLLDSQLSREMRLIGRLLGLALLMWLAYRGWNVLLAAAISGEPLLAHRTQTLKTPT